MQDRWLFKMRNCFWTLMIAIAVWVGIGVCVLCFSGCCKCVKPGTRECIIVNGGKRL